MIRAMLVVSGRMYGGGQRVVLDIMEEARLSGEVACDLRFLGGPVEAIPAFPHATVPYDGRYNRPLSVRTSARALRAFIVADRPDVVHSHGWDASLIAALALRGTGVAHAVHLHTTDPWLHSNSIKHRIRRRITRWILERPFTGIFTVSAAVRSHWAGAMAGTLEGARVVLNGVDTERFRPKGCTGSGGSAPTLGTAARLQGNKGLEDLIASIAILGREGLRPRVDIAGEGGHRQVLEEEIRNLGLEGLVHLVGFQGAMEAFLGGVDIAVLPSRSTEGLPLFILEAMSCGLPVVATDVGGAREAIRDGKDGLLVPPRDPEALAGAIRKLLLDPDLRVRMGAKGRERAVSTFSRRRFFEGVRESYAALLSERDG